MILIELTLLIQNQLLKVTKVEYWWRYARFCEVRDFWGLWLGLGWGPVEMGCRLGLRRACGAVEERVCGGAQVGAETCL